MTVHTKKYVITRIDQYNQYAYNYVNADRFSIENGIAMFYVGAELTYAACDFQTISAENTQTEITCAKTGVGGLN